MQLGDLDTSKFSIGKAAVFYAPAWDFASDLNADLLFLGFTEGEVGVELNETYNQLMLNEYSGDAPHKTFVQGEAPVVSIPIFTADPLLRAILAYGWSVWRAAQAAARRVLHAGAAPRGVVPRPN